MHKHLKIDSTDNSNKYTNKQTDCDAYPTNKMNTAKDLNSYLNSHKIDKTEDSSFKPTNTRIPGKEMERFIGGGSFNIPENEYFTDFLPLYAKDTILKVKDEFLTETQLKDKGPILVDIDLRHSLNCKTRQYTSDHIQELICSYLDNLKEFYQFDSSSKFQIFILEKDAVNPVPEKNITKDGIHIIFGIHSERSVQLALRKKIVEQMPEIWPDFPLHETTWENVFDKGIAEGTVGWQLYGSRKPNYAPYKLTFVYTAAFDQSDREFTLECLDIKEQNIGRDYIVNNFLPKLSARYSQHPQFFLTSQFMKTLSASPSGNGSVATMRPMNYTVTAPTARAAYRNIRNAAELSDALNAWLDSITHEEYAFRELHEYTMALPEKYYGTGSYTNWIRVGWALRNTVFCNILTKRRTVIGDGLILTWFAFSAKYAGFDWNSISDLYDKWYDLDTMKEDGKMLTNRSIMYWCREDAPEEFEKIRRSNVEYYLDITLDGFEGVECDAKAKRAASDYDIALVLYQLYKSAFVCSSIKTDTWYKFDEPCWVADEKGVSIRNNISTELRGIYQEKLMKLVEACSQLNESDHADKIKSLKFKINKVYELIMVMGDTNAKDRIMKEARCMFYDKQFNQKIDENPYLLACKNGVLDFKQKIFRRGYPEDYLTRCTGVDYIDVAAPKYAKYVPEIEDYMHKLFPKQGLYEYMWAHLASTLIGDATNNQTFHTYIGFGRNGKSVLGRFMELALGKASEGGYKGDCPLTLLTSNRTELGKNTPEVAALKGVRYAVTNEAKNTDRINEGRMKEMTSGIEPLQGCEKYKDPVTFIPQFKLALFTNELMKIDSMDEGTWRRIRVVTFMSLFTEKPVKGDVNKPYQFKVDPDLMSKLSLWKETFLSMLANTAFKTNGILPECEEVLEASREYRKSQDFIMEFFNDRIVLDSAGTITKTELSQEFNIWYNSLYGGNRGGPNIKEVQARMDATYKKSPNKKGWIGVRINYNTEADMEEEFVEDSDEEIANNL